ncbi:MAG: hypothetical protein WCQ47_03480 [bacterium]
MKKFYCTFLMLSFLSCGGGGGNSNSGVGGSVTIKGTLAGGTVTSDAIDINQVKKIVVFSSNGVSNVADIKSDGSFELKTNTGSPVGLIFAGASNNFLGYLTLSNGIDSIPLTKLADGLTTIDLNAISSSAQTGTPGHNPLGTELPFTSAEQTAIAQSNGIFASLVKNPDVDSNGVIDVLESKFYRPFVTYSINAGSFASGSLTPTIGSTVAIQFYNVTLSSQGTTDSGGAKITGPVGSGITSVQCYEATNSNQLMYSIYSNIGTAAGIPAPGEYILTLDSAGTYPTRTFTIPDQSLASSRIVVAIPTITLNSNGTINKINWVYRMPNDPSSSITATALIESVIIQLDDASHNRLYNAPNVTSDIVEHTLTNQNILWSDVTILSMAYNDVYGNHNVVGFTK